jgi:hypothetical protein
MLLRMKPVDRIVDLFGGLTALAKALGHENPSTVQGWKARGVVPVRQIPVVIEKAAQHGIALTPADFFDNSETQAAE